MFIESGSPSNRLFNTDSPFFLFQEPLNDGRNVRWTRHIPWPNSCREEIDTEASGAPAEPSGSAYTDLILIKQVLVHLCLVGDTAAFFEDGRQALEDGLHHRRGRGRGTSGFEGRHRSCAPSVTRPLTSARRARDADSHMTASLESPALAFPREPVSLSNGPGDSPIDNSDASDNKALPAERTAAREDHKRVA